MKKITTFLFALVLFVLMGMSSTETQALTSDTKQELRAAWVATVYNLDIGPQHSNSQEDIDDYKQRFTSILNVLEQYKMNTIIFQIRPTNDAFYPSELNPWSKYFIRYEDNDPGWDPLEWMIEETHKRGMEFHAWLNPYRVSTQTVTSDNKEQFLNGLSEKNFARKNPDLVIIGNDGRPILNPGEPEVKQFLMDTVEEIIVNYDVDAIHFDDYFYPYSGINDADDQALYDAYRKPGETREDWRRRNVDEMIYNISQLIRNHNTTNNKAVQFGISPFGIWANKGSHPEGSDTRGNQSYFTQYADTRKWVKEEWIDYIAPQLYWNIGHSAADYEVLAHWWADVVRGTNVNLYIGMGVYRYDETGSSRWNYKETILRQFELNRTIPEIKGEIFYAYRNLLTNGNQAWIQARFDIRDTYWKQKALTPYLPNLSHIQTQPVKDLEAQSLSDKSVKLSWEGSNTDRYYLVYRFEEGEEIKLNSDTIYDIVIPTDHRSVQYTDTKVQVDKTYIYHITAVSIANEESESFALEYTHLEEEQPSDTDPTEPSETTEPTEPTEPSETTGPTEPTEPSETTESSETSETTESSEETSEPDKGNDDDKDLFFPIVLTIAGMLVVILVSVVITISRQERN